MTLYTYKQYEKIVSYSVRRFPFVFSTDVYKINRLVIVVFTIFASTKLLLFEL